MKRNLVPLKKQRLKKLKHTKTQPREVFLMPAGPAIVSGPGPDSPPVTDLVTAVATARWAAVSWPRPQVRGD